MSNKTNWAVGVYRDGEIVVIFQHERDADEYLRERPKWTKKKCAINLKGLVDILLPAHKE